MLQANDNKHEMTLKRKYESLLPTFPKERWQGQCLGFVWFRVFCLVSVFLSPLKSKCYQWREHTGNKLHISRLVVNMLFFIQWEYIGGRQGKKRGKQAGRDERIKIRMKNKRIKKSGLSFRSQQYLTEVFLHCEKVRLYRDNKTLHFYYCLQSLFNISFNMCFITLELVE